MKKFKWLMAIMTTALIAASVCAFAACSDKDVDKVTAIVLNEEEVTLEAGKSFTLTATVYPENAKNKKVTWSSDDTDCATVDENGVVTAKADAEDMSCMITATSVENNEITETCGVIVIAPKGDPITKTAKLQAGTEEKTNTFTVYTGSTHAVELKGFTVLGSTALPLKDFNGTLSVINNAIAINGSVTAMYGEAEMVFPVLNKITFKNQKLQIKLYVNNGESDFDLGTYEFTKEEAAFFGIDTTKPYILTSSSDAAGNTIELWSDNKIKGTLKGVDWSAVGLGIISLNTPVTFETTWIKGTESANKSITIAAPAGKVSISMTTIFGSSTTEVALSLVAQTKPSGLYITVTGTPDKGDPTVFGPIVIGYKDANENLELNIEYVKVTQAAWDSAKLEDGKLKMTVGDKLDLNTIVSLIPTENTLLSLASVAPKEGTTDIVTIDKTTVTAAKAGTVTLTAKVDDIEIELTVAVEDLKNPYENPISFDTAKTFTASGMATSKITFNADGTCHCEINAFGQLYVSDGFYTLEKEGNTISGIKYTFSDATVNEWAGGGSESAYSVTAGEGGKLMYTAGEAVYTEQ